MGMELFYVTVFGFFLGVVWGGRFRGFAVFFEGVLEKEGVWVWCFDGEFVVECVVEMDRKQRTFRRLKIRQGFELYFLALKVRCPSGDWLLLKTVYF
jgi:hypothetical protein